METVIELFKSALGNWPIALIIIAILFGLFTVDEQEVAIVTRFGKFVRVAHSGLNIKIPFIESVAGRVSLRVEELVVEVKTKTKDNVFVEIHVAVQNVAMRDKAFEAFYRLEDPSGQMESYVMDAVRAKVPALDLDELFERKDEIADEVQARLADTMSQYGWTISKALVTDIAPDEKVVDAMNNINAARRERDAAQARADGEKILKVTAAQADAEAMALEGKGIADQRKAILDGLAASVDELQKSIPGVTAQEIMAVIMMTRYFDTLRDIALESQTNTIMLPSSPGALGDFREQVIAALAAGKTLPAAPATAQG